jgi:DNA (cytosine-5)-methyltransferase 1
METVAFCEIEEYPQRVLRKHWPDVPIYNDVRELTSERLRNDGIPAIDVLCGGFPCQPFSTAAAGRNPPDQLSLEFGRVVWQIMPRYVIAENTERKAFSEQFIGGLRALNYSVYPKFIPASAAGADHERGRWWVCAYPNDKSELPSAIDAEVAQLQEVCAGVWGPENYARAVRVSNGLPYRMDRIKCLGNSVLPQIPELIGKAIMGAENG